MKNKYVVLIGMMMLLLLGACSQSNEQALEKAPDYIKKTWPYYVLMDKTAKAIENGENVPDAFDKYNYTKKRDGISTYIDKALGSSKEEKKVIDNIHLMYSNLDLINFEDMTSEATGKKNDVKGFSSNMDRYRNRLAKIYSNYDLELEKSK
ncbi:hypothetical protein [Priestia koreensis]|uniref:Lipoprotein n=1 Tax=Priestia koreensis TaxID=284581 RepID=A0A0M0L919_9BACI|nr:hypothetical protein [Priestia koreensis]KOO47519.1 hypothetical protein AMD01_05605 [Priestia koreensis]MCM3006112.1 hypothetical protein [Priestia koreensis]